MIGEKPQAAQNKGAGPVSTAGTTGTRGRDQRPTDRGKIDITPAQRGGTRDGIPHPSPLLPPNSRDPNPVLGKGKSPAPQNTNQLPTECDTQ